MKRRPDIDDIDEITKDEIASVIDDTIDTLALLRGHDHDPAAGRAIDAIVVLIAQARSRLPDHVAAARDDDNTWAEIADQLHVSRARAIARYWRHTQRKRPPLELD